MIVKRMLVVFLVLTLAACSQPAALEPNPAPTQASTPTATISPAPTLTVRQAPLAELLEQQAVEIRIRGAGIDNIRLELRRSGGERLEVQIPAGTLFLAGSAAVQNMIVTRGQVLTLEDDGWTTQTLEAACVNLHRDVPTENETFLVSAAGNRNLEALLPVLEQAGAEYSVRQAAIWIVTDDASYADLGILVGSNPLMPLGGSRLILEPEAALAMQLIEQAGLDITRQRIWQDREQIAAGVSDADLLDWLAGRNNIAYLDAIGGWTTLDRASQLDILLYAPDGSLAVTSACLIREAVDERINCIEGRIQLWEPDSGEFLRSLPETPSSARPLAIAPDGSLLAAGVCSDWNGVCRSGQVWLYDPGNESATRILPGIRGRIQHLAFSPNGNLLAVGYCARMDERGCQSTTVDLLSLPGGSLLHSFSDLAVAGQIRFSPDGALLAILDGQSVQVWNVTGGGLERSIQTGGLYVRLFEFTGGGNTLFLIDQIERLNPSVGSRYAPSIFRTWTVDLSTGQAVQQGDLGELQVDWGPAAISPQADLVAVVVYTQELDSLEYVRQVLLLDAETGGQIASLDAGVNVIYNLAFDNTGESLSALTNLGMVISWQVPVDP